MLTSSFKVKMLPHKILFSNMDTKTTPEVKHPTCVRYQPIHDALIKDIIHVTKFLIYYGFN